MNRRGAALFDLLLSGVVGVVAIVIQSAVTERITAIDLLAGAILAACIWLIRQQYVMGGALKAIQERLQHLPTRKEVTDEIGDTRHLLRNEAQSIRTSLDERVTVLERGGQP